MGASQAQGSAYYTSRSVFNSTIYSLKPKKQDHSTPLGVAVVGGVMGKELPPLNNQRAVNSLRISGCL